MNKKKQIAKCATYFENFTQQIFQSSLYQTYKTKNAIYHQKNLDSKNMFD